MLTSPVYLQKNDKVIIIAPAGKIAEGSLDAMICCLNRWGLRVIQAAHLYAVYHGFAGSDAQRTADLQAAVDNTNIKAVFCARGGYGCSRIMDAVDFSSLLQYPKWLVGYSDITALHARWNRLGLASIHGVMSAQFPAGGNDSESTESLQKALFGESLKYTLPSHPLNKTGETEGVLVGGNLTVITHLTGSPDEPDTAGKILFIEDTREYLYALDRMMLQLQRSGKLQAIKGLIAGYFTDMKDNETPFGATAYEIISTYMKDLPVPVCYGFPAGHEEPNLSLIFGKKIKLSVRSQQTALLI